MKLRYFAHLIVIDIISSMQVKMESRKANSIYKLYNLFTQCTKPVISAAPGLSLLDFRTLVLYNDCAFISHPLMSDNLVIIPHTSTSNYSGQFPLRSLRKGIRSSSSRGTNISSSPKSASLIPYYPIPVPYSRIRSSKNSAIFYSKLLRPEGGFEPDLNGFLNQKQSASTAGRVKPQLNEFLSQPVGVEFESNCSRTTVNQAKILFQSYEFPPLNPAANKKIDLQNILIGFGGGARRAVGAAPHSRQSRRDIFYG